MLFLDDSQLALALFFKTELSENIGFGVLFYSSFDVLLLNLASESVIVPVKMTIVNANKFRRKGRDVGCCIAILTIEVDHLTSIGVVSDRMKNSFVVLGQHNHILILNKFMDVFLFFIYLDFLEESASYFLDKI